MSELKKQKLTLSVDKVAVEKAKEIGLNISEITENVLRGYAAKPTEGETAEVYAQYRELFSAMLPTLKRYGLEITVGYLEYADDVGDIVAQDSYHLVPSGKVKKRGYDASETEVPLESVPQAALFHPQKILTGFIDRVSEVKQKNKERIQELQVAKKIIETITESLTPKERRGG